MPLHIEHRPQILNEIIGNKAVVESLRSIFLRKADFPHAYLFTGPTGCGKTSIARIVAKLLQCSEMDYQEYNMANLRGIETIRGINEDCRYAPSSGPVRFYLFDEIHRQTKDAKEALLKLLEEPPPHVYFALCTTEPENLPPTMIGRCHSFQMKPLPSMEMMSLLKIVLKKEKLENFPEKILKNIVFLAEGRPRNALVLLDSVIDMEDEEIAIEALSSISLSESNTKELCQSLLKGANLETAMEQLKAILNDVEPERIRQAVLGYMANTLCSHKKKDAFSERISIILDLFGESIFYNARSGIINMVYKAATLK